MVEHTFIRILVATALCLALFAFVSAPVPVNLPAPAFEQTGLYRLEVSLLVFYGSLLLITPASSGLIRGRLPTEISTRGAKFADETDRSAERNDAEIKRLQGAIKDLAADLATTRLEFVRVKKGDGDSAQPPVDSGR
jgi:hypothetical protein